MGISHHIMLTGFMATGKTTVGRLLAAQLGCGFVDLDDAIVQAAGKPVAAMFAEDGELAFRRMESEVLVAVLQRAPAVIATGGGTVLDPQNRARMMAAGTVVCLDAAPETIWQRLQAASATQRPLADGRDVAAVAALWAARAPMYAGLLHHIATDRRAPQDVAARVLQDVLHVGICR